MQLFSVTKTYKNSISMTIEIKKNFIALISTILLQISYEIVLFFMFFFSFSVNYFIEKQNDYSLKSFCPFNSTFNSIALV
jgi:hypothetical protein